MAWWSISRWPEEGLSGACPEAAGGPHAASAGETVPTQVTPEAEWPVSTSEKRLWMVMEARCDPKEPAKRVEKEGSKRPSAC